MREHYPDRLRAISMWPVARERASQLSTARLRDAYGAVLDALEEGWGILWPLAIAARSHAPGETIAIFTEDLAEEWRHIASECLDSVPGPRGFTAVPGMAEAAGEMEMIGRLLTVLDMASAHPAFPAGMRESARMAVERFEDWLLRFAVLLEPIAELEDLVVCDLPAVART